MQYLLHDLIKLPIQDRLVIFEQAICSLAHTDYEQELKEMMENLMLRKTQEAK